VIHKLPSWTTALAALGELPELFHQTGCLFHEELVVVDEYAGSIEHQEAGAGRARAIGRQRVVLPANHGVIVTGDTLPQAVYLAACFDRQCRLAYDVIRGGAPPARSRKRSARKHTISW